MENFYIGIFNNLLKEEKEHEKLEYLREYYNFFHGYDYEHIVSEQLWNTYNLKCLYQLSLQSDEIKNNINDYEAFLLKAQAIEKFPMIEN